MASPLPLQWLPKRQNSPSYPLSPYSPPVQPLKVPPYRYPRTIPADAFLGQSRRMTPQTNAPKQALRPELEKLVPNTDKRVAAALLSAERREYSGEPVMALLYRREAYFLAQEGKVAERKPIIL